MFTPSRSPTPHIDLTIRELSPNRTRSNKRVKLEVSPSPRPGPSIQVARTPNAEELDNTDDDNLHEDVKEDEAEQCSICLQPLVDRTVIPTCAHEFCFECILVWTEQSRRCPLCSQQIREYLIHYIRSKFDYQKHFLPPLLRASPGPSSLLLTRLHNTTHSRGGRGRERTWGRRARIDAEEREVADGLDRAIARRKWVYEHRLFAKHVASNPYTLYRPSPTPTHFASSPDLISRMTVFLRRELRVWDVDVEWLTTYTISLMKSIDIRSEAAVGLLSEFLDMDGERRGTAEHFAHEVYCYLRSPYRDLTVYDSVVQYDTPADILPPATLEQSRRWRPAPPPNSRSPRGSLSRSPSFERSTTMALNNQRVPSRERSKALEDRDGRHGHGPGDCTRQRDIENWARRRSDKKSHSRSRSESGSRRRGDDDDGHEHRRGGRRDREPRDADTNGKVSRGDQHYAQSPFRSPSQKQLDEHRFSKGKGKGKERVVHEVIDVDMLDEVPSSRRRRSRTRDRDQRNGKRPMRNGRAEPHRSGASSKHHRRSPSPHKSRRESIRDEGKQPVQDVEIIDVDMILEGPAAPPTPSQVLSPTKEIEPASDLQDKAPSVTKTKAVRPVRNRGILDAVQAHLGTGVHKRVDTGSTSSLALRETSSFLARLSDLTPASSTASPPDVTPDPDTEPTAQRSDSRLSAPEIMARTRARLAKLKNEPLASIPVPASPMSISDPRGSEAEAAGHNSPQEIPLNHDIDIRARLLNRLEEERRQISTTITTEAGNDPRKEAGPAPVHDAAESQWDSLSQAAEAKLRVRARVRVRLAAAKRTSGGPPATGTRDSVPGPIINDPLPEYIGGFDKREEALKMKLEGRR